MKELENQIPEWGEANKPRVADFLALLNRELKDRLFVAGDHYSVADITTLVAIDLMKPAKLAMPDGMINIQRWHAQVNERSSAAA
jgi:glutathione S-transferase